MAGRRAGRFAAALLTLTALAGPALSWQAADGAPAPSVAGGVHEASLEAVSCPSPTLCISVGRRAERQGQAPFAERWNGSSWTIQAIAAPKSTDAFLVSVTCASSNDCTAVGGEANSQNQFGPLAEQWNGHSWRLTQAGNPAGVKSGNLASVSCASEDNCVAAGMSQAGGRELALSERWNGRSWRLLTAVKVRRSASFTGVRCIPKGWCMAVGEIASPGRPGEVAMAQTLTSGVWHMVPTPVMAGSSLSLFNSTWCANRFSCLAVGQSQGASDTAIAATWAGSSWAPQPLSGAANQILFGISCSSPARCMAVGSGVTRPVSQLWTGASWTPETTAHIAGGSIVSFHQVSCPTATRCIAVGARTNGSLGAIGFPLAEEWNGSSWRVLSTPHP